MKKLTIMVIAVMFSAITLKAQETLYKSDEKPKIFVAPIIELSKQSDLAGISGGLGFGLMISDFYLGGYYLDNVGNKASIGTYDQRFVHGGLWAGYILNPDKLVHYQAGLKLGYGSLINEYNYTDNISTYSGNLFILNPNAGAEINITSFLRFGVNAGYRFTTPVGVDAENMFDVKDVQGMTFEAVLKIGFY